MCGVSEVWVMESASGGVEVSAWAKEWKRKRVRGGVSMRKRGSVAAEANSTCGSGSVSVSVWQAACWDGLMPGTTP